MIFTVQNTAGKGKKVKVFDARGTEISGVTKYNSKTREVTMFLGGTNSKVNNSSGRIILVKNAKRKSKTVLFSYELVKVTVKIPGSYIVVDNKKI